MNLFEILSLLILHWIADFILQDEEWAVNKSHDMEALISHTLIYSWFFLIVGWILLFPPLHLPLSYIGVILFVLATFITHTITDYFTSRVVSERFKNNHLGSDIPNFGAFTIIGADQILHYIQLFTTYYIIFK